MLKKIITFFAQKEERRQFLRFCCVGSSSFCFEYIIFTVLNLTVGQANYNLLGLTITGLFVAHSVSYFIAFWYCFWMNRTWTFRSSGRAGHQLKAYALLFLVNLIISNALIHLLGHIGVVPQIGKILVAMIISIWNFFAYRFIFSLE
ncbi:MAG: GtrA family protein [Clostridia bacterium]|nr:GtrA family protein [Clostridia bacterium]